MQGKYLTNFIYPFMLKTLSKLKEEGNFLNLNKLYIYFFVFWGVCVCVCVHTSNTIVNGEKMKASPQKSTLIHNIKILSKPKIEGNLYILKKKSTKKPTTDIYLGVEHWVIMNTARITVRTSSFWHYPDSCSQSKRQVKERKGIQIGKGKINLFMNRCHRCLWWKS